MSCYFIKKEGSIFPVTIFTLGKFNLFDSIIVIDNVTRETIKILVTAEIKSDKKLVLRYLIIPFMKADITAIPRPLPDTIKISTSSLRLLKYCATINVLQSLVMPTPIPGK